MRGIRREYIRRAQRMGDFTISVNLPKDWVRNAGIGPGDLVAMSVREDGALVIRPSSIGRPRDFGRISRRVLADECGDAGLLGRILVALYIAGADDLVIESAGRLDDAMLREIRRVVFALNGANISEESEGRVTIYVFVDPAGSRVSDVLRRMSSICVEMLEGSLNALRGMNADPLKSIDSQEMELNRHYWLAVRQLLLAASRPELMGQIGVEDPGQIPGFRTVAKALEEVGDAAADAARELALALRDGALRPEPAAELSGYTEHVLGACRGAFDGWFGVDPVAANSAVNALREARRKLREAVARPSLGSAAAPYLYELAQVAAACGTVAEMTINRSVIEASRAGCVKR
ncbi:MAG: PhoU domain-containing protein [Conexivisphaera sp.]